MSQQDRTAPYTRRVFVALQSAETSGGLGGFGLAYAAFLVFGAALLVGYALRKRDGDDS